MSFSEAQRTLLPPDFSTLRTSVFIWLMQLISFVCYPPKTIIVMPWTVLKPKNVKMNFTQFLLSKSTDLRRRRKIDTVFSLLVLGGFLHRVKTTSHEIYPLHKLLGVQYSIVTYRHNAIQQISRIIFILHNWNLYPLINISLFSNPLAPDNHHSALCFFEFDCFRYLIYVESCSMYLFVTHLFNLV